MTIRSIDIVMCIGILLIIYRLSTALTKLDIIQMELEAHILRGPGVTP